MKTGVSRRDALGYPVCPEHSGKPLIPFVCCFLEALAPVVKDDAIVDLSLTISFGWYNVEN